MSSADHPGAGADRAVPERSVPERAPGAVLGVLGDLVEDIVVWLHEPVQWATDTEVTVRRSRGGSAANVAAFAAADHPVRFIGCVGQDAAGDWLLAELASHGVDLRVQRRGTTGTVIVQVDQNGERTMFPYRGAAALLEPDGTRCTEGLAHLHVPAYTFTAEPAAAAALTAARRMRAAGGTVSLDASSTGALRGYGTARFLELLAALTPDVLFANRAEADQLAGHAGGLADLPAATVVVKDGARPTTVHPADGPPLRVPVPPVAGVRDLTGAGDAFAAGYLTAVLGGASAPAACRSGHATAARVLANPGASSPR